MHLQKLGDFRYRFLIVVDEPAGVCDLLNRQDGWPAELHAFGLCRAPTGARALYDQGSFKIHDASQNGQHLASIRGRRVGPCLGQRPQAGVGLLDPHRDRQKVGPGSGKSIKARHRHHVAGRGDGRASTYKHVHVSANCLDRQSTSPEPVSNYACL